MGRDYFQVMVVFFFLPESKNETRNKQHILMLVIYVFASIMLSSFRLLSFWKTGLMRKILNQLLKYPR